MPYVSLSYWQCLVNKELCYGQQSMLLRFSRIRQGFDKGCCFHELNRLVVTSSNLRTKTGSVCKSMQFWGERYLLRL
jgi:hypothetical protein